jgi:hypothetical protein
MSTPYIPGAMFAISGGFLVIVGRAFSPSPGRPSTSDPCRPTVPTAEVATPPGSQRAAGGFHAPPHLPPLLTPPLTSVHPAGPTDPPEAS